MRCLSVGLLAGLLGVLIPADALACLTGLAFTPTDKSKTVVRQGFGQFGAPRADGSKHDGVDLVALAQFPDKGAYAVAAVQAGTVAYARFNGKSPTDGYGNVVVLDHRNNCYSVYAHLASDPFTPLKPGGNLEVKVGQKVAAGQTIGYFVNTKADLGSSGNAMVTNEAARHQLHFAMIEATSGRSGAGGYKDLFLSKGGQHVDPTSFLRGLGYETRKLD